MNPVQFVSKVLGLLLVFALPVRADSFSVEIVGGKTLDTKRTWWVQKFREPGQKWVGQSVGDVTVRTLEKMQETLGIEFEASLQGVRRIGNLGSDLEVISDKRMRAFGWCFRLEKGSLFEVPELMPDQVVLSTEYQRAVWFYGYAEYDADRGGWISQCVPAGI